MKIMCSPRLPRESSSAPDQAEEVCAHMEEDKEQYDNGTYFCIYNDFYKAPMKFILFPVSDTEIEMMKKQSSPPLKKRSPPNIVHIDHFGSTLLQFGTSFVSVGSIGGLIRDTNAAGFQYLKTKVINGGGHNNTTCAVFDNQVRKFDTNISEFVDDPRPPPMNEPRFSPAVVAIGNIIYVFAGLSRTATQHSSWAECLNTDMPIALQKWMPLKQPPFTFNCPFAIPYGNDSILIANTRISEGALLYNVRDGSWMKDVPSFKSDILWRPFSVLCEKTIYWTGKLCIHAYDYDNHVRYTGLLRDILYEKDFLTEEPYFMHLKDDIFCCFTSYAVKGHRGVYETIAVKCTAFQVTKISDTSGHGKLHLCVVGCKYHKCGTKFSFSGVVSIQTRICLPKTEKSRSGAKK